jgi:predicted GIY-YIG superfamily endonuclease
LFELRGWASKSKNKTHTENKNMALRKKKSKSKRQTQTQTQSKPLLRPECDWFVYVLTSHASRRPYIGKTNDLERRLRQHNGELVGGAKRTHRKNTNTDQWVRQLHLLGFPDERAALQFEWRMQYDVRKNAGVDSRAGLTALDRAVKALRGVLERDTPTSGALPLVAYAGGGIRVRTETVAAQDAWKAWGAGAPHVWGLTETETETESKTKTETNNPIVIDLT